MDFTLFLNTRKGQISPMRFYIYDCEKKKELEKLIEDRCGFVDNIPSRRTISLAPFRIKSVKFEVFSINYIFDCCRKNKLLDLKLYRLSNNIKYAGFDPMHILTGKELWPFETFGDVHSFNKIGFNAQQSNNLEPFVASVDNKTKSSKKSGIKCSENLQIQNNSQSGDIFKTLAKPPITTFVENGSCISTQNNQNVCNGERRSCSKSVTSQNYVIPECEATSKERGNLSLAFSDSEGEDKRNKSLSIIPNNSSKSQRSHSYQKCTDKRNESISIIQNNSSKSQRSHSYQKCADKRNESISIIQNNTSKSQRNNSYQKCADKRNESISNTENNSLESQMSSASHKCVECCSSIETNKCSHNINRKRKRNCVYEKMEKDRIEQSKRSKCHKSDESRQPSYNNRMHYTTRKLNGKEYTHSNYSRLCDEATGHFSTAQNNCRSKKNNVNKPKAVKPRHFVCSMACEHNLSGTIENSQTFSSQRKCDKFISGSVNSSILSTLHNYPHDSSSSSDSSFNKFTRSIIDQSTQYGYAPQNIKKSTARYQRAKLSGQFDANRGPNTRNSCQKFADKSNECLSNVENNTFKSQMSNSCQKCADKRNESISDMENNSLKPKRFVNGYCPSVKTNKCNHNVYRTRKKIEEGSIKQLKRSKCHKPDVYNSLIPSKSDMLKATGIVDSCEMTAAEKCQQFLDKHVSSFDTLNHSLSEMLNVDNESLSFKGGNQSLNTGKTITKHVSSPTNLDLQVISTQPERCNNYGEDRELGTEVCSVANNTFKFSNETLSLIKDIFTKNTKRDIIPYHVQSSNIQRFISQLCQKCNHSSLSLYDVLCAAIRFQPLTTLVRESTHNNQCKVILINDEQHKNSKNCAEENLNNNSSDNINHKDNAQICHSEQPQLAKQTYGTSNSERFPINLLKSVEKQENSGCGLSSPVINKVYDKNNFNRDNSKSVSKSNETLIYEEDDTKYAKITKNSTKFSKSGDSENVALPNEFLGKQYLSSKITSYVDKDFHISQCETSASDASSVSTRDESAFLEDTLKEKASGCENHDLESIITLNKYDDNINDDCSFLPHSKNTDTSYLIENIQPGSLFSKNNKIQFNSGENKTQCERKDESDPSFEDCDQANDDDCDGSDSISIVDDDHYQTCASSQQSSYLAGISPDVDMVIPPKH